MDVNRDYRDLLQSLSDARARFLVVGAYAVMYHTEPRYTKDMDIWVAPSVENAARVWKALVHFGAPLAGANEEDFINPDTVFQIGMEPNRIDLMTDLGIVGFETAWKNRVRTTYGGLPIYVLGKNDLIRAKRAAGRPHDMLDVRELLKTLPGYRRRKTRKKRKKR